MALMRTRTKIARDAGFAQGVAAACGIIQSAFDQPTLCAEALLACGYSTRAELKAAGADDYDLKLLRPVFAEIKLRRQRESLPHAKEDAKV